MLKRAWELTSRVLVLAARLDIDRDDAHAAPFADGWLTSRGTFQKFFRQDEMERWVQSVIGVKGVAGGPGVFYVFRDSSERERFLAARHRLRMPAPQIRKSDRAFVEHRSILQPLISFVGERGRLPRVDELPGAQLLVDAFGSLARAFRVVLWVTDEDEWRRVSQRRAVDLLVYLALAQFGGPTMFGQLPKEIQYDVRAFFPSFKEAKARADRLLFAVGAPSALNLAVRASLVGKVMPTAIYVHADALGDVPAALRVYEGCARVLTGTVEGANVIKMSRDAAQVSYLAYPDFDREGHPALQDSVVVDLRELRISRRRYRASANPPVLHRKEELVLRSDPRHPVFTRLTEAEERLGLFADPARIGSRTDGRPRLRRLEWPSTDTSYGGRMTGRPC